MITRRTTLALGALFADIPLIFGNPSIPRVQVNWHQVVTGGGGLITGVCVSDDGQKVCRTDTCGDYVFDNGTSKWVQMLAQNRAPVAEFDGYRGMAGVADLSIAANDSDVIYRVYRFQVWKSVNKGLTSFPTNYPVNSFSDSESRGAAYFHANNNTWKFIKKIGIDPANKDVVYASNPGGRALVTFDGGLTWEPVPDLPTGKGFGAGLWTFDPNSGTTGSRTNSIWCAVTGSGVWRSTTAGSSWMLIDAGVGVDISSHGNAAISSDGVFYIVWKNDSVYTLSRYETGSFSTIHTDGSNGFKVATHPVTGGVVCTFGSLGMEFRYSLNYGSTFTSFSKLQQTWESPDAPWQAARVNAGFSGSASSMQFDPNVPDTLWLCCGQGIWSAEISAGVAPSWITTVIGIEQLVMTDLCQESGTDLFRTCWDEGAFKHATTSLHVPPNEPLWGSTASINLCSSVSIDPTNHDVIVIGGTAGNSGFSTDGGDNFQLFPTIPPGFGNTYSNLCINDGVIIWVQPNSGQGYPYRSDDFGITWTALDGIANIPTLGETGWSSTIFVTRHTVWADRVNPDKFYMYNYLSGRTPPIRGVYMSDDKGITWRLQSSPGPFTSTVVNLYEGKCVPGIEGYIFAANGHISGASHPGSGNIFVFSTDGGGTWSAVADILSVQKFGFGKTMPGSIYPTLYIVGFYKQNFGVYRSTDLGVSWTQLWDEKYKQWPLTNDVVTGVDGDKDIAGRVYINFGGSGSAYCDLGA